MISYDKSIKNGNAAFVIPFWSDGKPHRLKYLNLALESIFMQTDENWRIYLVDDASPYEPDKLYLKELEKKNNRIKVLFSESNAGPGKARNKGILEAYKDQCPFICFLDSDDITENNRVEVVRNAFLKDDDAAVVYSSFKVIDEENYSVPKNKLIEGIKTIISDMETRPLEGYDSWIHMAVERDTLTIPSSLNVRTLLSVQCPFPENVRFHEDTHTWLRYSAAGAKIVYIPQILTKYRVPQKATGSESRERAGGIEAFNRLRAETILQGLDEAINMAQDRGIINHDKGLEIKTRYCLNVASMIKNEGTINVARDLVKQAQDISNENFSIFKYKYCLDGLI
jgi:glycosyltransferase involved in cell wall biosynthesis